MQDKEIVFTIEDDVHARFKIALFYDRLGQSAFVKHVIAGYLDGNKHIRAFVNEIIEKKNIGKNKTKNRVNDAKEEAEVINDFALNEEEIENIFDIIESESQDL